LRLLLLVALFVRALVPAGFMPAVAAQGHGLTLVICSGSGGLQTITVDEEGKKLPAKSGKTSHEPCAFSGHLGIAAPSLDVATLLHVLEPARPPIVAANYFLPPVRAGPALGSRAPPFHS